MVIILIVDAIYILTVIISLITLSIIEEFLKLMFLEIYSPGIHLSLNVLDPTCVHEEKLVTS